MRFLYNLAAILIVTIIIPIFMLRATRERGFVERIKQSFGFYPQDTIDKVAGKNAIWVHAASVGEIVATSPLVREFRKKFPDSPILVSVVTTGGYEMAHRIIKDADAIIYFPLDLPFLAARVPARGDGALAELPQEGKAARCPCHDGQWTHQRPQREAVQVSARYAARDDWDGEMLRHAVEH